MNSRHYFICTLSLGAVHSVSTSNDILEEKGSNDVLEKRRNEGLILENSWKPWLGSLGFSYVVKFLSDCRTSTKTKITKGTDIVFSWKTMMLVVGTFNPFRLNHANPECNLGKWIQQSLKSLYAFNFMAVVN